MIRAHSRHCPSNNRQCPRLAPLMPPVLSLLLPSLVNIQTAVPLRTRVFPVPYVGCCDFKAYSRNLFLGWGAFPISIVTAILWPPTTSTATDTSLWGPVTWLHHVFCLRSQFCSSWSHSRNLCRWNLLRRAMLGIHFSLSFCSWCSFCWGGGGESPTASQNAPLSDIIIIGFLFESNSF